MSMIGNFFKNPITITVLVIVLGVGGLIGALMLMPGSDENSAPYVERYWGKSDSAVVVTEYADFQCIYCKLFHEGVEKPLKEEYGDKIKFVYKHYPLHNGADRAAEAAEAAGTQNKFWEYHDLLFAQQKANGVSWDRIELTDFARQLGLDTEKFEKEYSDRIYRKIVSDSEAEAKNKQIRGTPYIEINGEAAEGVNEGNPSFEEIKAQIDSILATKATSTPTPTASPTAKP